MLKFKAKNLTRLYTFFILLVFFIISCKTVETNWAYKISDPYHENTYHNQYIHRSYAMNIKLAAKDSDSNTYIQLQIMTPLDSIKIYPALAYIKSPHFEDTVHYPIYAEYTVEDSLSIEINKDEISKPYFLNKNEELLVNLTFKSFATYIQSSTRKLISEKGDFIFYYDIFDNKQPLTFNFTPAIDSTKNK